MALTMATPETPAGPSAGRLNRFLTKLTPSASSRSLNNFNSPALSDVDSDLEPPQFVSEFMRELASDVDHPPADATARSKQRSPPQARSSGLRRSASLLSSPSLAPRVSPSAPPRIRGRHSEDAGYSSASWSAADTRPRPSSGGGSDGERKTIGIGMSLSSNWNRSREALGLGSRSSNGASSSRSRPSSHEYEVRAEQLTETTKTPGPSTLTSRPSFSRVSSDELAPHDGVAPTPGSTLSLSHRTPGAAGLGAGLSESSKRFRSAFRLKSRDPQSTLRKPMRARADEQAFQEETHSSPDGQQPSESESDRSPDDHASTTSRPAGPFAHIHYRPSAPESSLARAQLVDEEHDTPRMPRPSSDTLRAPVFASRRPSAADQEEREAARPASRNANRHARFMSEGAPPEVRARSPSPPPSVDSSLASEVSVAAPVRRPPSSTRVVNAREDAGRRLLGQTSSSPDVAPLRRPSPPLRPSHSENHLPFPQAQPQLAKPPSKRSLATLESRTPLSDLGARLNSLSLGDPSHVSDYRVPLKGGSVSPPNAPLPALPSFTVLAPSQVASQPVSAPTIATAAAPAASKRNNVSVVVNGKGYLRSALLGKGGSSRVYRITDREHNVFAYKRVELGKGDLETYHSFCNEIELLKRLKGHDRIIQLVDSEVNEPKRTLAMVMEIGEIDLNSLLQERAGARVSMNFIRYTWEQMLEAVKVVHDAGIVHTDLKPANFVLVKGALKLIDFGIAKAIPSDTTNIARDQQIGTANYMSPEALCDSGMGPRGERLMKMGRPSDVWSLGCILYQMVYGTTPFGGLRNLQQKMLAIQNPMHQIEFPPIAIPRSGGVEKPEHATPVEADLVKVMRSCLRFESKRRATIPELLEDPFLRREAAPRSPEASAASCMGPEGLDPALVSQLVSRAIRWSAGRTPSRHEQDRFVDQLVRQLEAEANA